MINSFDWNNSYRLQEKVRCVLKKIRNQLSSLNNQHLTYEQIKNSQIDCLKIMVEFSREHSEYWGDRLSGIEITSYDDIQKIPFTTKADLQKNHAEPLLKMLGEGKSPFDIQTPMMTIPIVGCNIYRTSGSTGSPSILVCLPDELTDWSALMGQKMCRWFHPEDKVINLYTPAGGWAGFEVTVQELNSTGAMAFHLGNNVPYENILEEFLRYRFNCVSATPTWFAKFLTWLENSGNINLMPKLDKFISGAEPPTSYVDLKGKKIKISEYLKVKWNAKLISEYTGTETGLIGLPLSDDALNNNYFHTIDEAGIIEIVDTDQKAVEAGQAGELVATSFSYLTTPLFRFRSGDAINLLSQHDPEVPGSRLIKFCTDSRVDDCMVIAGRKVTGASSLCENLTKKFDTVFQLILQDDSQSNYDLALGVRTEIPLTLSQQNMVRNELRNDLQKLVVMDGKVDDIIGGIPINFYNDLIYGSTGKFKQIINNR